MEEYVKKLIEQLHSGVDYIFIITFKNRDEWCMNSSMILDMRIVQHPYSLLILYVDGGFSLIPFSSICMIDCEPGGKGGCEYL